MGSSSVTPFVRSRTRIRPVRRQIAARIASSDASSRIETGTTSRSGSAAARRSKDPVRRLVGPRRGQDRWLVDAGRGDLAANHRDVPDVAVGTAAVHDRVGGPEHPEQRPSPATVVRRALDQPGDLDELDENPADPGQGRGRTERRERVVTGLDLDLRQGLEQGRLADVRRADEGDLGRTFPPDGDRVAVHGARPDPGVLDLGEQRLAEIGVRTVLVVGQLGEEGADLADAIPALFPDESPLGDLGKRPMWHRHGTTPSNKIGGSARGARSPATATSGTRPFPPLPSTLVLEGAAQPFLLAIVASQASRGRRPFGRVMGGSVAPCPIATMARWMSTGCPRS